MSRTSGRCGMNERGEGMKLITTKEQNSATEYLSQIMSAILSRDEIKCLKAIESVAELAYITGGIKAMEELKRRWT